MLNATDLKDQVQGQEVDNLYVGVVIDNNDPSKQGKVRAMVPELYEGMPKESVPWAQPQSFFGGGNNYGMVFIPPVGSKVYITLWKNHPWYPVYQGSHWFEGELPTEGTKGYPNNYLIKTPSGHIIELSDAGPYIRISDPSGNYITLNTNDNTLNINVASDVRIAAGGNVDIKATGSVAVQSLGAFDVMSLGNINLRAAGMVNIDGTAVNIGSGAAMPRSPQGPKDV